MVGYRKNWQRQGLPYRITFQDSFKNPEIPYTIEDIRIIYHDMPDMRPYLFYSLACTPEFLAECFDEALLAAQNNAAPDQLIGIAANPNTPMHIIENIAVLDTRHWKVNATAKKVLEDRRALENATNTLNQ